MVNTGFSFQTFVYSFVFAMVYTMQACASTPQWIGGMPKHHTTEGFRNYPIVENTPSLGLGFYYRRLISSLSTPQVPEDHFLTEENAVAWSQ